MLFPPIKLKSFKFTGTVQYTTPPIWRNYSSTHNVKYTIYINLYKGVFNILSYSLDILGEAAADNTVASHLKKVCEPYLLLWKKGSLSLTQLESDLKRELSQ